MPGVVTVRDRAGRTAERRVEFVKGHPRNPMGYDDVAEKFRLCASLGVPGWNGADLVIDAVRSLETLDNPGGLLGLCQAGAGTVRAVA
jgi:2-methylcitrate dehydratase PrpD